MIFTILAFTGVLVTLVGFWLYFRLRRGRVAPSPFPELPLRVLAIGPWQIRYHMSGRGPYMVLIHGIGANLFCWRELIAKLNDRYTLIALDLPGFGQSSKLTGEVYGLDEQVERVQQFLNQLGVGKMYLVGNSMGGNIALWFTKTFPERVLGTVVIGPATSPKLVPLSISRWAWLSKPVAHVLSRQAMRWAHRRTVSKKHLVGRERIEETFQTYGRKSEAVRSFMLATESIRDNRLLNAFSKIKTPVLILWGARDLLVPQSVIRDLQAQIKHHQSAFHRDGGHHLQEDEPDWVAEKIDTFVRANLD